MAKYVKVCPRCGRVNDEFSEVCEDDGEFLGMVPATQAANLPPSDPEPAAASEDMESHGDPAPQAGPVQVLYLDAGDGGRCYEIHNGWTIGQAHATSTAQVQLTNLPGLQYVHRRHCQFELGDDGWHVVAVAQPAYTNPTLVNSRALAPGERVPVRNGDRLTLSSLTFSVRILTK